MKGWGRWEIMEREKVVEEGRWAIIGRQMANEKDSGKEKCNGSGGTRTTSGIGLHAWK